MAQIEYKNIKIDYTIEHNTIKLKFPNRLDDKELIINRELKNQLRKQPPTYTGLMDFPISLYIENNNCKNIRIENCDIAEIKIENCKIEKFEIKTVNVRDELSIINTEINSLQIDNTDFESISEFNKVILKKESIFKEIGFKGLTLFDECVFETKVKFEYVRFDDFMTFRDSEFKSGLNLDYTNTKNPMNFFGVKGLDSKESKQNTSQETYRIIKYNFEQLNNKVEANKYHSLELQKLNNYIWGQKKFRFSWLSDGIVLFLNRVSSNYSTSWALPLLWIAVASFLTIFFQDDTFSLDNMFKYASLLTKFEDFNCSYVAMTLNKISLGYLYYQFLTAVRKDTRK